MKAKVILFLIISMIIVSCAQQKRSWVEGAWKLVHQTSTVRDTLIFIFPDKYKGSDIKIWSKEYVLYVGQFKSDTSIINGYGGGPYKLEGNRYEENIQFFSVPSEIGKTVKMLLEIKNDTLIQTWPVGDNGQIDKSNFRQQKYVRLD